MQSDFKPTALNAEFVPFGEACPAAGAEVLDRAFDVSELGPRLEARRGPDRDASARRAG